MEDEKILEEQKQQNFIPTNIQPNQEIKQTEIISQEVITEMNKENVKTEETLIEKSAVELELERIKKGKKNDNFIILGKEEQKQKEPASLKSNQRKIKLMHGKHENRILRKRQQIVNTDEIFCVRFSCDDKLFAAGCGDGTIQIQDVKTGNLFYKIICAEEETPTTIIRWRPSAYSQLVSNVLVVADSDGILTHWHIPSGLEQIDYLCNKKENSIFALDFTPDSQLFATSGKDCEIRIYSEERQEISQTFSKASWQHPGHANRVFSLKCCPITSPMQMVSGGWDSNLHLWDIRQRKSVACCFGPLVQGDSIDVQGNQILVGGYRHGEQITIYDVRNLEKQYQVVWENRGEEVQVYCCQFEKFREGKSIAAATIGVNEMRLFDPVNKFEGISYAEMSTKGCYTLDYGNKTNVIGFGGGNGISYICELPLY